jgi:hypothetical protein
MRIRIFILVLLALLLSGCASPTSTVAPSPSALTDTKPVVIAFRVSPVSITAGQKAMLQWEVTGTTVARIEPELGNVGASGSIGVSPFTTTTYTIIAGATENKATATITLTVERGAPVVEYFFADSPEIYLYSFTRLHWNVIGATTVSINNGIGSVAASGDVKVSPNTTTLYTLTASNAEGSVTASVWIINRGRIFEQ